MEGMMIFLVISLIFIIMVFMLVWRMSESEVTEWYGMGEYEYKMRVITNTERKIEFYLFSDKMYLYPDEVLRALQKKGTYKSKLAGIHYKQDDCWYFIPFDSIQYVTMYSRRISHIREYKSQTNDIE